MMGKQHGHRHTVWTGACSMDVDMQHEPGHGHGPDMDIHYYWTGTDSGQLYFSKVLQKSWRKLAEVRAKVSGIVCKSYWNFAECVSGNASKN